MSNPPAMAPGTFGWNELVTPDTEACKAFFAGLMGWTSETNQMPGGVRYTMFKLGDRPVGGMMAMEYLEAEHPDMKGTPPHWMSYLTVEDVDASCAKCRELGGAVIVEPTSVPDVGRFAIVTDPTGAPLGLAQYEMPQETA